MTDFFRYWCANCGHVESTQSAIRPPPLRWLEDP